MFSWVEGKSCPLYYFNFSFATYKKWIKIYNVEEIPIKE